MFINVELQLFGIVNNAQMLGNRHERKTPLANTKSINNIF